MEIFDGSVLPDRSRQPQARRSSARSRPAPVHSLDVRQRARRSVLRNMQAAPRERSFPMPDAAAIRRLNPDALGTPPGYSQVVEVRAQRLIFISGQTATDARGNIVGKGDFAAQAQQVFANLSAALEVVGCTAANLVKLTVFLRDME